MYDSVYYAMNPMLHSRLSEICGEVEITNPGEAHTACGDVTWNHGEEYKCNCPFCHDTRKRLYVNHTWGVRDENGFENRNRMYCHNEQCHELPSNRDQLHFQVYSAVGLQMWARDIRKGRVPSPICEMTVPCSFVRVDTLPGDHRAVQYLASRKINAQYVGKYYGVGFADYIDQNFVKATNRLIIPTWYQKKLVGWQARTIGDDTPKYWTAPRMAVSRLLYNYDVARLNRFVVVTEGVTDVWPLSGYGVATFGASLSRFQVDLIRSTWPYMLLAYDEPDKVERARPALERIGKSTGVGIVEMPQGADPGSLGAEDPHYLWDLIHAAAHRAGLDLNEVAKDGARL